MIGALTLICSVVAVAISVRAVLAARTHARPDAAGQLDHGDRSPTPHEGAGHVPSRGVCPGSDARSPSKAAEPAIVGGVRPDGGGTTLELPAPPFGWRPEVAELIATYESTADPPSRCWQFGDRSVWVKPIAGGIRIEARGDAYIVITPDRAVLILQAQAVDLWPSARSWGEHWLPRVHELLTGEAMAFGELGGAGWRGTGLHLAIDLAGVGAWPIEWMSTRDAWGGRGVGERVPTMRRFKDGTLRWWEIGDATSMRRLLEGRPGGASPTIARGYNKSARIERSRGREHETLRARWRAAGWSPEQGPVYRVEGGLRGKALRLADLDLTDPVQLLDTTAHLRVWAYLFGHPDRPRSGLIRLLDPTDQRRRKDRRLHPIWRAVQAGAREAPALSTTQIRDATEAEADARTRRATTAVRKGLATLAVADGHTQPRAAATHAMATTQAITTSVEWPGELDVAQVNFEDLRQARARNEATEHET